MKKALTILVLATVSSLACAQAIPGKLVGPWYVGISGGQSRADLDDWDYYNGFSVGGLPFTGLVTKNDDTRDSAWRIFLGYNFNQNWAVEGAYADLGRIKARYAATATGVRDRRAFVRYNGRPSRVVGRSQGYAAC